MLFSEVSSTTSDIYSRLGVHGLVSDRLPGSTTVVETIKSSALRPECRKREAVATNMRTGLKSVRSLDDGRHSNLGGPTFRVRLSQNTSAGRTVLRKRTSPRTIPVRARLKMVGQSMNATSRTYGKRPYPTSRFRRASIFDRLG
ncbi:hypothetical protein AB6A40_009641 [Gnathostoma spinigerum]|uniref:Uncharacterized protein n=1 Tax=Gnathostoma spinigerum TaxID=75299 RepID=A0ABD6EV00_9BILA